MFKNTLKGILKDLDYKLRRVNKSFFNEKTLKIDTVFEIILEKIKAEGCFNDIVVSILIDDKNVKK